jgi:hypothetical protein
METTEHNRLTVLTRRLMLADNMGDVHEVIDSLHDLLGLDRPHGDFLDGWTEQDLTALDHA